MRVRNTLFILAFFVVSYVPFGVWLSLRPMFWVVGHSPVSATEVRRAFPLHLASMGASATRDHLEQLEQDDPEAKAELDVLDWSLREARYRGGAFFVVFMASGFFLNLVASRIIRGKATWD